MKLFAWYVNFRKRHWLKIGLLTVIPYHPGLMCFSGIHVFMRLLMPMFQITCPKRTNEKGTYEVHLMFGLFPETYELRELGFPPGKYSSFS